MTESDTLAAVERWFRSRGIPHFIDDYSASRDVFTRALAPLTAILVLELVTALDATWPWWLNLGVAVAGVGALLAVWAVVNVARKRPALARPDRVGGSELAIFVLLVPILDLLAGGQRLTALNTLLVYLAFLALIYLGTSYALLPITRWAAGRLWRSWPTSWGCSCGRCTRRRTRCGPAPPGSDGASGATWASWCCSPRDCRSCS